VARFTFEYDFEDSWEHDVVVEGLTRPAVALKHAVCIDGANACPPEDVGGTSGYVELLSAVADPVHEAHETYLEWAGGPFDPAEFDLGNVNAPLQKIR
jgi:pRiA4b ORF-3-like protein